MISLTNVRNALQKSSDMTRAKTSQRFFKTGLGEYGEGDIFIGVTVPRIRQIAKEYKMLPLEELHNLVQSSIHEERLTAIIILVLRYAHATEEEREAIYKFYISHIQWINNWDLVDCSAEYIVGPQIKNKSETIVVDMALSKNVWERRIAIISTFYYIKKADHTYTFRIAKILLNDKHDLIQKAVGWMLREVGKRCGQNIEEEFLQEYYTSMPRTMLRYSLEHFSEQKKKYYMQRKVISV